ncbi:MAG: type I methionyl aminopeptidase [Clostridia bacterium]
MIIIKTKSEIEKLADAGKIVAEALAKAQEVVRPGISTAELNAEVEKVILSHHAAPSFKGYRGFPSCCCISPNEVVVHGIPSKKVILKEGDIVSIDVGACYKGYHGDAARTFPVGEVSPQASKLIEVTRECFFKGAAMAAAGNRIGDIGFAVQSHAEENGFGVVRELVGHGVGKNIHEAPDVPNFGRAGHGVRLVKNMVLAIEPMITAGGYDVNFDEHDGWTVRTNDKSLSAHYENTVVVTDNGPVYLTLQQ